MMEEEKERARVKAIKQREEEAEEKARLASEAQRRDVERLQKERDEEAAYEKHPPLPRHLGRPISTNDLLLESARSLLHQCHLSPHSHLMHMTDSTFVAFLSMMMLLELLDTPSPSQGPGTPAL